jgi:hypothetical protein
MLGRRGRGSHLASLGYFAASTDSGCLLAMYGTDTVQAKAKAQALLIQVSAFIRIQVEPKS